MSGLENDSVEKAVAVGIAHPRFEQLCIDNMELQPTASARYAYCAGIEAWTVNGFREILSALSRILKPGGIVRIVAQDLDAVVYGYLLEWKNDQSADATRAQRLNVWRRNETAQYIYNEEDLRTEFENAGFVDIWRLPAGASSIKFFRDCELSESAALVLEGRNPVLRK
jgi:predicted SAM-dependent methyltransferase